MKRTTLHRRTWAVVAIGILPLTLGACSSERGVAPDTTRGSNTRPNVVVIVLDTLRKDYLELYGFDRQTAPFLKRLGDESAVFDNAFSTSSCTTPSTASLFTGLYPQQHGLELGLLHQRGIQDRLHREKTGEGLAVPETAREAAEREGNQKIYFQTLAEDLASLPAILRDNGYRTFGLSTNINITEALGFDRGFHEFEFESLLPAKDVFGSVAQSREGITAAEPYFLYLHLMDPHVPYHPRTPYFRNEGDDRALLREAYLSEVRYMDDYLERIYDVMNCDENTVLIVVSDHGEEFWDHGSYYHGPTLYAELNRILMMVHAPGLGIAAQRLSENVSLVDVLPTLLDLIDLTPPEPVEGLSLTPLLSGTADDSLSATLAERTLFAHRAHADQLTNFDVWAAIHGDRKLIVNEREGMAPELYNMRTDPTEQTNVYTQQDADDLLRALDDFRARERRAATVGELDFDEELESTLEALGYVN